MPRREMTDRISVADSVKKRLLINRRFFALFLVLMPALLLSTAGADGAALLPLSAAATEMDEAGMDYGSASEAPDDEDPDYGIAVEASDGAGVKDDFVMDGSGRAVTERTASVDGVNLKPDEPDVLLRIGQEAAFETGGQSTDPSDLPVRHDSRDAGKHPTVKSQGKLGTCWAITATSALEAYFQPEDHYVFSADHMSLQNGFSIDRSEGGDYRMIMAYLRGWYGPVLEKDDPYGDGRTTPDLAAAVHVKGMRMLEGADRNTFKEMILRYGCVQSSLYMSRYTTSRTLDYYNEETSAYRYTEKNKANHDILVLGWDDTFPGESFKIAPREDGAWICQNTWGEDFGEDGIFYVSYEDAVLFSSGLAYTLAEEPGEGEKIYQTDVCGWQGRIGYDSEDCSFANVYQTGKDPAEYLTGVGFYSIGEHSSYEIYIVHDFEDEGSFIFKKSLGRGETEGVGFFGIELEEPEPLEEGERFAVAVSIHTEGEDKPVAVELKKDEYTANVTTEGKEGYISPSGGDWEGVEDTFDANVCLKAYTRTQAEASGDVDE